MCVREQASITPDTHLAGLQESTLPAILQGTDAVCSVQGSSSSKPAGLVTPKWRNG